MNQTEAPKGRVTTKAVVTRQQFGFTVAIQIRDEQNIGGMQEIEAVMIAFMQMADTLQRHGVDPAALLEGRQDLSVSELVCPECGGRAPVDFERPLNTPVVVVHLPGCALAPHKLFGG